MRSRSFRVITSCLLIMAAAFALFGCKSSSEAGLTDAVKKYSEALIKGDTNNLRRASLDMSSSQYNDLKEKLDLTGDAAKIRSALEETITYTIDEDSIEVDGDEAKADVVFGMADWEKLTQDETAFATVDSYVAAIKAASDRKEVRVTLELKKADDAWKVSNHSEAADKFYGSWLNAKAPSKPEDVVKTVEWHRADYNDGIVRYTDASSLECVLLLNDGNDDLEVYCEVYYKDQMVYKTPAEKGRLKVTYGTAQAGSNVTSEGHLAEGDYSFWFYNGDGVKIAIANCTVSVNEQVDISVAATASSKAVINQTDIVKEIRWWWFDSQSDMVTYNKPTMIDMEIRLNDGYDQFMCYYTVEYEGQLVYKSALGDNASNGFYLSLYDGAIVDDEGYLAGGTYKITYYDSQDKELASDYCNVTAGAPAGSGITATSDNIVSTLWMGTDSGSKNEYTDTDRIDFEMLLDSNARGAQVYYEVRRDGELIYTSVVSSKASSGVFEISYPGAMVSDKGHLLAGSYEITFYTNRGVKLVSDSCTVKNG